MLYDYSVTPDSRRLSLINKKGSVCTSTDTYQVSAFLKSLPSCDSQLDWYLNEWWRVLHNDEVRE